MREGYERALVLAAQDGDPRAVERLVAEYLPLVYNVVGRALDGHADVDDVVQETMLRCVTGLRGLRDPASFRAWLVAIAVRQVRDRQADPYRARQAGQFGYPGTDDVTDPAADFANLTILRLELSGQRREVVEATRWLDQDDQELLSLWWLETSGELTRDELAQSLGVTNQHAAVRVQRMKATLDTARTVVRALSSRPRCPELVGVLVGWSGHPDALWRKRLARHIRECAYCGPASEQLVAAERLLAGIGLVAPAAGLVAASISAAGGAVGGAIGGAGWTAATGGAAAWTGAGTAGAGGTAAGAGSTAAGAWGAEAAATAAMPGLGGGAASTGVGAAATGAGGSGAVGAASTAAKSAGWLVKGFLISKPVAAAVATVAVATAAVVTFGVVRNNGDAVPAAAVLPPVSVSASPLVSPDATPSPTAVPSATVSPTAKPPVKKPAKAPLPPTGTTKKKGAAVWDFPKVSAGLKAVGASWYYNWGANNDRMPASGVEFVPMIWGTANATDSTLAQAKREGDTLLGFNEPDMAEQANMTPAKALELWPKLQATGMRLGSPSVAFGAADSGKWLDTFMKGAKDKGYRVDFITLHWYGGDFSSAAVGQLKGYIQQVHAKYGLPIWLTEFALIRFDGSGAHYPTDAQQVAFINGATDMLEGLSYVERYSWFGLPSTGDSHTGLYKESGQLTPMGTAYRAAG
ncbi:RNA polymerase sigma factor, sigma-70 family [Asanoa hainanensis]|uniref:RNA polymerase sigma factor, sigma-70 family n=1 Tax=Asanoa hainanensis TaxID=560556 RepID=A0A239G6I9_9ACTN|nr:sigma-70 family RNA polymerase sigma factor [Asanoa hainanensis]SNS64388.1 RNA polymerase sigma factor, sigma-70 family [Asanoa hainanensis]